MDLASPYDFGEGIIQVLNQIVEKQHSSPQVQEFIRLAKLPILIAYTDMP